VDHGFGVPALEGADVGEENAGRQGSGAIIVAGRGLHKALDRLVELGEYKAFQGGGRGTGVCGAAEELIGGAEAHDGVPYRGVGVAQARDFVQPKVEVEDASQRGRSDIEKEAIAPDFALVPSRQQQSGPKKGGS
jgi:hypothetical protein